MRGGEGLQSAHEVGQGNCTAAALAMSRLIEPHDAIAARQQRRDKAAHLHAAATPAMDEQNARRCSRPGLPDGERVFAGDHGFAPRIDRMHSAAGIPRRQGEQALRLTAREAGEQA